MLLTPLKNSASQRTRKVGISRYKVFYLTPSESGDLEPGKKRVFFPGRVKAQRESFKRLA